MNSQPLNCPKCNSENVRSSRNSSNYDCEDCAHVWKEEMDRSKKEWHRLLADYFETLPTWQKEPTKMTIEGDGKPTQRKVAELPYQLIQAGLKERLSTLQMDLNFVEAKCLAGMLFDLLRDCEQSIASLYSPAVTQIKNVLTIALPCLLERPFLALQTIYNRLIWIDQLDNELLPSLKSAVISLDSRELWVKAEAPIPKCDVSSQFTMPFVRHSYIQSISSNNQIIAIASQEGKVELRDIATGEMLTHRTLNVTHLTGIVLCGDQSDLAFIEFNGQIRYEGNDFCFAGRAKEMNIGYHSAHGIFAVRADNALVAWDYLRNQDKLLASNLPSPLIVLSVAPDGNQVFFVAGESNQTMGLSTWAGQEWIVTYFDFIQQSTIDADIDWENEVVLIGSKDRHLRVFDIERNSLSAVFAYEAHPDVTVRGIIEKCALGRVESAGCVFFATRNGQLVCWNWLEEKVERLDDFRSVTEKGELVLFEVLNPHGHLFFSTQSYGKRLTNQSKKTTSGQHLVAVSDCLIAAPDKVVSISQLDQTIRWFSNPGLQPLAIRSWAKPCAIVYDDKSERLLMADCLGNLLILTSENGAESDYIANFHSPVLSLIKTGNEQIVASLESGEIFCFSEPSALRLIQRNIGGRKQDKILPANALGLCWSIRKDIDRADFVSSVSLIKELNNEEIIFSTRLTIEDVAVSTDGETLCIIDETVSIFQLLKTSWKKVASRHDAAKKVVLLGNEPLIVVVRTDVDWLEIWNYSDNMQTAAAIELPSKVSCLYGEEDRIIVGFQSGQLMSLQLKGKACNS